MLQHGSRLFGILLAVGLGTVVLTASVSAWARPPVRRYKRVTRYKPVTRTFRFAGKTYTSRTKVWAPVSRDRGVSGRRQRHRRPRPVSHGSSAKRLNVLRGLLPPGLARHSSRGGVVAAGSSSEAAMRDRNPQRLDVGSGNFNVIRGKLPRRSNGKIVRVEGAIVRGKVQVGGGYHEGDMVRDSRASGGAPSGASRGGARTNRTRRVSPADLGDIRQIWNRDFVGRNSHVYVNNHRVSRP